MITVPYAYSYPNLCYDLWISAKEAATFHPIKACSQLWLTAQRVQVKFMSNLKEYILEKYRERCHLHPKSCTFHSEGNPFLRDYYSDRPQPSIFWVIGKVLEYKVRDTISWGERHPALALINAIAISVLFLASPWLTGSVILLIGATVSVLTILDLKRKENQVNDT